MCHGVSPTRYFKDELTRIMRNKNITFDRCPFSR